MEVANARLRFAQLKAEFSSLRIKQPLVFIQWKRPGLDAVAVQRIRQALAGQARPSDMQYVPVCAEVIAELKAA